jgi:hypothetical protein
MKKQTLVFLPFVFLSILALLTGLWAGLLRLGWSLPVFPTGVAMQHGVLMVSGFLGTLITLERVAALRKRWMFSAPLLTGVGWIASSLLPGSLLGPALITAGSLGAVLILCTMVYLETALHTAVIGLGAFCWLTGNLLWLNGKPIYQIVFWWAAFLVLTIAGERLELGRVLQTTRLKRILFLLAIAVFLAGVIWTARDLALGERMAGAGLVALAAWLVVFDLARRNLRHRLALTRYIAWCLFAGYFWLGLSGALCLWMGAVSAGPYYDAVLHTLFIGFVLSMIFGHAPIIFPAFLGKMLPYHPSFAVNLALLHASLLLRIVGDLGGWASLRQWGGLLNEISLVLFLVSLGRVLYVNRAKNPHAAVGAQG